MSIERTFAIIKPDAFAHRDSGKIIDLIEQNGFNILGMQLIKMTLPKAQEFYAVHKSRPFFGELTEFITSGPCIVMTLEKDNAILEWRTLMGATDPMQASPGTIRKLFGANIGNNAVHGSDAPETARQEINLFFPELA
jgi:nucleoside-diphosphate kinase